jgi:hypothetical protein
MICEYMDCKSNAIYNIEWWGLNQHGKNPEIIVQRYSCSIPRHLLNLSRSDEFGGYPNRIEDLDGNNKVYLLRSVKKALDNRLNEFQIEGMISNHDPDTRQLTFNIQLDI